MIYLRDEVPLINWYTGGEGSGRIPTYGEALAVAEAELRRARRFEYPIAVMVFTPIQDRSWRKLLARVWSDERVNDRRLRAPEHARLEQLAMILRDELRETDLVIFDRRNLLFNVVCVQSTADQALIAGRRIEQLYREQLPTPLLYGAAEFPRDGLTIDALLERARVACGSPAHVLSESAEERSVG